MIKILKYSSSSSSSSSDDEEEDNDDGKITMPGINICYEATKRALVAHFDSDQIFIEFLFMKTLEKLPSKNFIKAFGFEYRKGFQYIFSEYGGENLEKCISKNLIDAEDIDVIIIQILHALYLLHANGIIHNDLHDRNILLQKVDNEGVDFYSYEFDDFNIYLPSSKVKYIVKICDFGMMMKYSEPRILIDIGEMCYEVNNSFRDINKLLCNLQHVKSNFVNNLRKSCGISNRYNTLITGFSIDEIIHRNKSALQSFSVEITASSNVVQLGGKKVLFDEHFIDEFL